MQQLLAQAVPLSDHLERTHNQSFSVSLYPSMFLLLYLFQLFLLLGLLSISIRYYLLQFLLLCFLAVYTLLCFFQLELDQLQFCL